MKTKAKQHDWVPTQLLRFNLWQGTFITEIQLTTIATILGIPATKLTAGLALQATYVSAYAAAPPHTRAGHSLIVARNDASKAFKKWIRQITAQYIRKNDGLTNQQLIDIGVITAPTGTGTHSNSTQIVERMAPEVAVVEVVSKTPGTVTFTYTHGKPEGMHHLLVQYIVVAANAAAPTGEDACTKHLEIQKSPYTKDLTRENSGMRLYGFAAWVDTRGVIHSWSKVFTCIIT